MLIYIKCRGPSRQISLRFALSLHSRCIHCHLLLLDTAMFNLCAKSPSLPIFFSLLQLLTVHHAQAQCYLPNGTVTTDLYHNRCSNDTSNPLNTICCAVDRTPLPGTYAEVGYTKDECLDSGICRNRYEDAEGRRGVTYWREECTEKDWRSGKCLNVCTDDVSLVHYTTPTPNEPESLESPPEQGADMRQVNGGTHEMTPCDGTANSTTWCCGNSASCCETLPITIAAKFGVIPSTSTSSATATPSTSGASQTTSSSVPAASSGTSGSQSSPSLSGGGIAGVVIGAIAGTALICTVVFLCIGKKRNSRNANTEPYTSAGKSPTYMYEADTGAPQIHEAAATDTKSRRVQAQEVPEMA
jgi:hypothetical protein